MSNDKENHDRKIDNTKKIILLVIIPLLLASVGLMGISGYFEPVQKPTYVEILYQLELECYNVNWFGTHGFQITYNKSMEEIGNLLDSYDMDFKATEFFKDQEVKDYMVVTCPHIDSTLEAPDDYDPDFGVTALDKCLEKKAEFFESEEYCLQFKT